MSILIRIIALGVGLFLSSQFIEGVSISLWWPLIIAATVLAIIHMIIKPILKVLTLPINIVTLGLFSLVLNALFFWFVANIINGFSVSNFTAAFLGAIVVAIVYWIADKLFDNDE